MFEEELSMAFLIFIIVMIPIIKWRINYMTNKLYEGLPMPRCDIQILKDKLEIAMKGLEKIEHIAKAKGYGNIKEISRRTMDKVESLKL